MASILKMKRDFLQSMRESEGRESPIEIDPEQFRRLGHDLVDDVADFLRSLPQRPVTKSETPDEVARLTGNGPVPRRGTAPSKLLRETSKLLFDHSLFNGHPRFLAYITSSAAPIGALSDFLASSVNPNLGAFVLSPVATQIELQVVSWIAEMIGYDKDCGGLLVSGGNMANFIPFLVARKAKSPWDISKKGIPSGRIGRLRVYASRETHTWIEKAPDLFGLGSEAVRTISVDDAQRMNVRELRSMIARDKKAGDHPFLVVGTAGTTATGAIDPLPEIAEVAREFDLWFHVDGAYGALAAMLPDKPTGLEGIARADSVAVDPHKWLYAPLEAGCVLVKNSELLRKTFTHHPTYYQLEVQGGEAVNFYEYGFQNSRGFRALKVWLGIRQVGWNGYAKMIAEDIGLAKELYRLAQEQDELEPLTQSLSITTLRYVPSDLRGKGKRAEKYLNRLNEEILNRIQKSGELYPSNAVVDGKYALRFCVVNFRTSIEDMRESVRIVLKIGAGTDSDFRKNRAS